MNEEFTHWLQGELHTVSADLGRMPESKWRELATYRLKVREVNLMSALEVLKEFEASSAAT
jgi:hypothetical protein